MWLHAMHLAANFAMLHVSVLDQSAWQIQEAHLFAELSPYIDCTCQAMFAVVINEL